MKSYKQIINMAEDYIEENLDKKISVSDIARYVNLSGYHFHRIFTAESNETIHNFISRVKLERSAILLIVIRDLTITEIAYAYGYSESSSYCRAFKKHFKLTPTNYRLARIVNT
jgi:AraC family transcriptional regulator